MTGTEKKTKAPTPFRIEQETADRFREAAKEFSNQDAALNALLAAFEREKIQESNPQFSEVMNEFEKYQRCLSAKFADVLKALATADDRARVDVQKLLESKDTMIAELQEALEEARKHKQTYEELYKGAEKEKKAIETSLHNEQIETERLRREMQEKAEQHASILSDKERLNDIMSQNVSELQGKIREYQEYPKRMQEKDTQIKELNIKVQELGNQIKDAEYQHKMELLDNERKFEKEKSDIKAQFDEKQETLREKYEKEIEKLRQRLEDGQKK
ncbi:MAG: hypothetical protein K1W35_14080 [Lachnospiraceae bacterium]